MALESIELNVFDSHHSTSDHCPFWSSLYLVQWLSYNWLNKYIMDVSFSSLSDIDGGASGNSNFMDDDQKSQLSVFAPGTPEYASVHSSDDEGQYVEVIQPAALPAQQIENSKQTA